MFDNYDPTKTTKETEEAQKDGTIKVTVSIREKKTVKERLSETINKLKNIKREDFIVFVCAMRLSSMYVLQGLVGVFTFTIYQPNWTYKSSLKLSTALADQRNIKNEQKEKQEKENEEIEIQKKRPKDMEEWLKRLQENQ